MLSSLLSKRRWHTVEIALRAGIAVRRRTRRRALRAFEGPTDVFLCIVDHFEPQFGRPSQAVARNRLDQWLTRYPKVAGAHRDWTGRSPAHSFFYPWDECDEWELARLSELCAEGWGEIEIHLHHRHDTDASLRRKLRDATATYRRHGALTRWPDGRPAFAFIHGNWALDNSRFDEEWCGVNNEIDVLIEEGCYADFTFPAWRQTAQPRQVNSIYWAVDDPHRPKSHDRGEPARRGGFPDGTALLMVQGPLVPFSRGQGARRRPAMDDGDLAHSHRYEPARLDRWVRAGIQVDGRPDRVFIKLFCHGAPEKNRDALLGEDLDALFSDAEARYNDGRRYRLHYVRAREMFNVVRATIADAGNDVSVERDYVLPPPERSMPPPASAPPRDGLCEANPAAPRAEPGPAHGPE